jgi:hypothetical protein
MHRAMATMRKKTQLDKFLDVPENMHAREQILMHRLFLDLKTAAALRGYYLNTYFDDVDHDGFDVIFDDQDYIKKIQVKSVNKDGSTGSWSIHKRILRPSFGLLDKIGFDSSPEGEGSEGGVILIEFSDVGGAIHATYYYTDVFVLLLFYCGAIKRKRKNSQNAIENIYPDWRKGLGSERISVPKAAFLKTKNAEALLSLMGLHSTSQYMWKHHAILLASNAVGNEKMPLPEHVTIEKMRDTLFSELRDLCDEPDIKIGTIATT